MLLIVNKSQEETKSISCVAADWYIFNPFVPYISIVIQQLF